jgi:hypothetical protein
MTEARTATSEIRRIVDEIRVRIHLAGMEAKDAWRRLEPKVTALEHRIEHQLDRNADETTTNLDEIAGALHDDLRMLHARLFPA